MSNAVQILLIRSLSPELWPILLPAVILTIAGLLNLLLCPLRRGRQYCYFVTLCTLIISALSSIYYLAARPAPFTTNDGLVLVDTLGIFSALMVMLAGLFTQMNLWKNDQRQQLLPEVYILLPFALVGMFFLVSTTNLLMIFVVLEIMSLAIYVMVAMRRSCKFSSEAGLKYFIMGGVASALFLYGTALVFGHFGTFDLAQYSAILLQAGKVGSPLLLCGTLLIAAAVLFKVGAFPFHSWIPDVYQGASTPITGFMAAAVKFVSFVLLIRLGKYLLLTPVFADQDIIYLLLALAGMGTMIWGNVLALQQKSLKRLLAYSSIAHSGYLFLGILSSRTDMLGYQSVVFYLTVYLFSAVGSFAVISLFKEGPQSDVSIESLRGLAKERPGVALALGIFLLSFAGIPLTAGFMGKYLLLNIALTRIDLIILIVALLTSLVSLAYYLKVILTAYQHSDKQEAPVGESAAYPYPTMVLIAVAATVTIILGIFPSQPLTLLNLIQ